MRVRQAEPEAKRSDWPPVNETVQPFADSRGFGQRRQQSKVRLRSQGVIEVAKLRHSLSLSLT